MGRVYKVMILICNYHAKTTPTHSGHIIDQVFCGVPVSVGRTGLTTRDNGCLGYPMNVGNKHHTFAWNSVFFIEHYLNYL